MTSTRRGGGDGDEAADGSPAERGASTPKPTAATLRVLNQPIESIVCFDVRYFRTASACSWVKIRARSDSFGSSVKAAMTTSVAGRFTCLNQSATASSLRRPAAVKTARPGSNSSSWRRVRLSRSAPGWNSRRSRSKKARSLK